MGRSKSYWIASTRRVVMAGWGTWVPSLSAAGLPAIPEAHRGGLERVEAAVTGMGRGDIPVVDERSVGNDEHLSP